MIARVEVPGTTIAGLDLAAGVEAEGRDILFTLTSAGTLPAVVLEIRMTRLEAATLASAIRDYLYPRETQ